MSASSSFRDVTEKHLKTLEQYVPIVARVHGNHHPEFHEVHQLFNTIQQKIKAAGDMQPDLEEAFTALRSVTGGYAVPGDTCETYEAVYKMLGEMDQAYHAEG